MADDKFGILDPAEPRTLTPPAGYEAVHQTGQSWAVQGERYETTTRITALQYNHIIAQFRGLATISGVDVADVLATSPFLLREFILRGIEAVLDGEDIPGHGVLLKSGGTMLGPLVLAADPTTALQAVTKQYFDRNPAITLALINSCI